MARTTPQNLPPGTPGPYYRVFDKSFAAPSVGLERITLHNMVRRRFTRPTEPPRKPTAKQLKIRAAFTRAGDLLSAAPYNERHAYWQLSLAGDMWVMHYYRHVNIGLIYRGRPDADIVRPDTWTTEAEHAPNVPNLIQHFYVDGPQVLDYEFTADPGTFRSWSGAHSAAPYEIWLRNIYDGGDYDVLTVLRTFNPWTRVMYQGSLALPPGQGTLYQRRVCFQKQVMELDRFCPLWVFKVRNVTPAEYWAWRYEQLTGAETMTQYGRPAADAHAGAWTNEAGTQITLWDRINETPASDTDYIQSELTPNASTYVCEISAVNDPQVHTDHIINVRYRKDPSGGPAINLTIELRQGYTSEVSPGTLIATRTYNNIPATWTDQQITLLDTEADDITDYSALFLRILATQV